MLYEEPFGILIEHAQLRLNDLIEHTEGGTGTIGHNLKRVAFFRILHTLPLTTAPLYARAKAHTAFEYTLFYERTRIGFTSNHFLDGVPAGVLLFTGETTISLPPAEVNKLKYGDLLADRLQTVCKLELMPSNSARKQQLVTQFTAGLDDSVPGAVRVLVARTRAMCQGVRQTKQAKKFAQCRNCNCNRLFYVGERNEPRVFSCPTEPASEVLKSSATGGGSDGNPLRRRRLLSGDDDMDDEEDSTSDWYWRKAGSWVRLPREEARTRRFCSQACELEYDEHVACIMPETRACMDADDEMAGKREGRSRVMRAFQAALKRNGIAARELRLVRWNPQRRAVSKEDVRRLVESRVMALNVDLGILYASSLIAESQALSHGKTLPGAFAGWRCDPMNCSRVLKRVIDLYLNYDHGGEGKIHVVSSMLTVPPFMEEVRASAAQLL